MTPYLITSFITLVIGLIVGYYFGNYKNKTENLLENKTISKIPSPIKPIYPNGTFILGSIRLFKVEKGYGFISYDGNKDIFFHVKSWAETDGQPEIGTQVSFTIGEDDQKRGKKAALNIKRKL